MPTNLFFKASIEKQEKILSAAKKEFSQHSYFDTSINRIIKDAEISRGSFYLYFADKDDLFFYILQEDVQKPLFQKYKEKYKGKPADLFELGLYFFDSIIENILKKEDFFINIFTTINMKQLSYFLKIKRSGKYGKCRLEEHMEPMTVEKVGEIVEVEKLYYANLDELLFICNTVRLTVANAIITMLLEGNSVVETREKLSAHFQILRRGFER